MPKRKHYDAIVIGGGIAGASMAYSLTEKGLTEVLLLEREAQPGYHATGRSAATVVEWDPIPALQELKTLGAAFLRHPPPGFSEHPLLRAAGILVTFQEPAWSAVQAAVPLLESLGTTVRLLSQSAALDIVPVLAPDHFDGAVHLPDDGFIDVHELLWSYLRHAGRRGAERRCGVEVHGIRVDHGRVHGVATSDGDFAAGWVVNAAGAWAGRIGALAGASPIAFTPMRRTMITFAAPEGLDVSHWPLVHNESHRLYFGPESGGLKACPMDEEPMEPCDAQPDDLMIAEAVERVARLAPCLKPRALRRCWAGLRTFAPDRVLVVGEDPLLKGFFWLAGQGGCGIETSPAVGQIAAELLVDGRTDRFDAALLSPARFAVAS